MYVRDCVTACESDRVIESESERGSPCDGLNFEVGLRLHGDLNSLLGVNIGTGTDGIGEGGGDSNLVFHEKSVGNRISVIVFVLGEKSYPLLPSFCGSLVAQTTNSKILLKVLSNPL